MTLTTLLIYICIAAVLLTALAGPVFKRIKNYPLSFLQNFCGAFFIFSGAVKAIDPMGTAFKMEQYFNEFTLTFSETWMSFITPIFPFLASFSLAFSVIMIVLEIVVGVNLIIGAWKKLTTWLFFLIVFFFTILTGFTYMTGYVPSGENFFSFSKWGPYLESNMRVTDCGCFGDFIKLEPYQTFTKDLFLMIPATIFLFASKSMHQLFSGGLRNILAIGTLVLTSFFCYYNFGINLPVVDFRPFAEGVNVRETKAAEEAAMAAVEVTGFLYHNTKTGEYKEVPYSKDNTKDFMAISKELTKEKGWEVKDQIKTKPTMKSTKISEFSVEGEVEAVYNYIDVVDADGEVMEMMAEDTIDVGIPEGYTFKEARKEVMLEKQDIATALISDPNYSFMVVCYKMPYSKVTRKSPKDGSPEAYTEFKEGYASMFKEKVNPLADKAEKDGFDFYGVTAGLDEAQIEEFRHFAQTPFKFHTADDILLKTIIRSNPGVVLMKDGKIIKKWHIGKLPEYEIIKAKYMR